MRCAMEFENVETSFLSKAFELGESGYHLDYARTIIFNDESVDLEGWDEGLFRMYFYDGKNNIAC